MSRHGHTMTPAALKEMTYTQAVLAECLRLYPVVGGTHDTHTHTHIHTRGA